MDLGHDMDLYVYKSDYGVETRSLSYAEEIMPIIKNKAVLKASVQEGWKMHKWCYGTQATDSKKVIKIIKDDIFWAKMEAMYEIIFKITMVIK